MDYNIWYTREDTLPLKGAWPVTPESAIVRYRIRQGDFHSGETENCTQDRLADLIAGAVFKEGIDKVNLFRINNCCGGVPGLHCLSASKRLIEVSGAVSGEDDLLVMQRKVGTRITERL